jgi:hypothetical protein
MGMPRKPAVEVTPDGRVYYIDHRNARWRVHDVAFGPPHARPHQRCRLAPGDGRAGYRYFVGEGGEQRSYRFTDDDSRDVTVDVLDSQLRRAEFPARGRFDGAKHYTP